MKSYLHDPVGHHAVNIPVRLRTDDIKPIRHLAKRPGYRVTVDSDFGLQLSFDRHDKPPDKRSRAPISVPTTCQPLFGISVPMSQGTENVPSGAFPAGLSAGLFRRRALRSPYRDVWYRRPSRRGASPMCIIRGREDVA